MPRKPPTVGVGDSVKIRGIVHVVVVNYSGKRGGRVYINRLRTFCSSHRFHDLDYKRTDEAVTCLTCLAGEVDAD